MSVLRPSSLIGTLYFMLCSLVNERMCGVKRKGCCVCLCVKRKMMIGFRRAHGTLLLWDTLLLHVNLATIRKRVVVFTCTCASLLCWHRRGIIPKLLLFEQRSLKFSSQN